MVSPSADVHASLVRRGPPSRRVARILLWVVLAVLLLGSAGFLLAFPVQIPSVVNTYADITSAHKWVLEKGTNGQLIASTINYVTGMSDGYNISNFNAGSSIAFSLIPSLKPGQHVEVGDTVGTVYSSEVQERLITLNGQLAAAERHLAVSATGEKAAVIGAAQQRLLAARRRREDYQATVERTQTLFTDHLLSQGEYDRVQSSVHALDDAIAIQEAELEAARTGAKPEQLALVETNIAALKDEIRAVTSRASSYTIRAPIAGSVSSATSGSGLLTISAESPYVALVAVRGSDYARVAGTPSARVTISGFSRPVRGRVLALNHEVQSRYGQSVVMATAQLDPSPADLLPGSLARCRIDCTPLPIMEFAKGVFQAVVASASAAGTH